MLRQRQICSRQRYGGRGKINKTINTISLGTGFLKKPRPQLKFNLSLLNCAILVHILKRENLRAYWILSMKFVIIVTHIKAGDSNENGKERSAISKFRLCLSGNFLLVSGKNGI